MNAKAVVGIFRRPVTIPCEPFPEVVRDEEALEAVRARNRAVERRIRALEREYGVLRGRPPEDDDDDA